MLWSKCISTVPLRRHFVKTLVYWTYLTADLYWYLNWLHRVKNKSQMECVWCRKQLIMLLCSVNEIANTRNEYSCCGLKYNPMWCFQSALHSEDIITGWVRSAASLKVTEEHYKLHTINAITHYQLNTQKNCRSCQDQDHAHSVLC